MAWENDAQIEDRDFWVEWARPFGWELWGWTGTEEATFTVSKGKIIVVSAALKEKLEDVRKQLLDVLKDQL